MNRTRRVAIAAAALSFWCGAIFGATGFANAQDWPSRPVKFIVPLGPGSGTDIGRNTYIETRRAVHSSITGEKSE